MSSIYLHIPFCRRLCGYCDFFKSVHCDRLDEVVAAMLEEIVGEREFLSSTKLSTIYFGGGTPSLLSVGQVEAFMERIASVYDLSELSEVTFEANPDDLTVEYLLGLRRAGIDRLSIGVQSFDDVELRFMNRRHSASQAVEAIENARSVGFDNIAIDLIFGVDGFGAEVLDRSLARALELDVEHIAAYHLTIEPGTAFARRVERGEFSAVDEDISEKEFDLVRRRLVDGGYEHYEISNYARAGCRSQHNSAYWRGEEYLGIGAGAHSFAGGVRRWGRESIDEWLSPLSEGRYECEELTFDNRRNEMIMTSLRCCEGLDLRRFSKLFGENELVRVKNDAKLAMQQGYLIIDNSSLRIPTEHFLRSDIVIESLFV
ncbi:MAG: radical SAM family heme chaperone HemW [Rikenellaceae bacterium]